MPLSRAAFWRNQVLGIPHTASAARPSLPRLILRRQPPPPRPRRFQSTHNHIPPNPDTTAAAAAKQSSRLSRVLSRGSRFLPARLRSSLNGLKSAPVSHIAAFLVLHEITAIVPLIGLTTLFYYMNWVPTSWVLGPWAGWAEDAVRQYIPWFRKRGLFGLGKKDSGEEGEAVLEDELREEARREKEREARDGGKGSSWTSMFSRGSKKSSSKEVEPPGRLAVQDEKSGSTDGNNKNGKAAAAVAVWSKVRQVVTVDHTEKGYKLGIQVAAAYTITKLLLVPRVALSLWMTPWLARGFVGFRHWVWKSKR